MTVCKTGSYFFQLSQILNLCQQELCREISRIVLLVTIWYIILAVHLMEMEVFVRIGEDELVVCVYVRSFESQTHQIVHPQIPKCFSMYLFYAQQLKCSNPFFMFTISCVTGLYCPAGVKLIEPTPSGQHVVVIPQTGDPQLWHVMSNSLTHTFKGT